MPVPHYSTGLKTLDALIGDPCPGIPRSGLTIISGGTASGKSSLCQLIATHVVDQYPREVVGLANIENRGDPAYHPYRVVRMRDMDDLSRAVLRSTYNLLIIDGVQYLELNRDPSNSAGEPVAGRARYLGALFTRTQNSNTALVLTWQSGRVPGTNLSIPASMSHRASLILHLENRGRLVMVAKNRFGDSGGVCEFGDRWAEKEPPEPEFDRSKIPTRFEREDVI